jgi:hypothetical protein
MLAKRQHLVCGGSSLRSLDIAVMRRACAPGVGTADRPTICLTVKLLLRCIVRADAEACFGTALYRQGLCLGDSNSKRQQSGLVDQLLARK